MTLNAYPNCGWLGLCLDANCEYLDVTVQVALETTYNADLEYFVYLPLIDGGCSYTPGTD